jgi:hypothetical protein
MKAAKKHKPTAAELANDPSLRWHAYGLYEPLDSDLHSEKAAFIRYDDGRIVLGSINDLAELPDTFDPVTVRRQQERKQNLSQDMRQDILTAVIAVAKRRLGGS